MKNTIFLLSISILFQSCYSYHAIDYNKKVIETNQKIKVIKLDATNIKGQLSSKNKKVIFIVPNKNRELLAIPSSEIKTIKIRKFSLLKTIGIIASSALTVLTVLAIAVSIAFST